MVLLLPEEAGLSSAIPSNNARALAGVFIWACAALLSGCASLYPQANGLRQTGLPSGLPARVELAAVPFFAQDEYQCGPAALAMALSNAGVKVTPQELVPQVYLPARQGSLQVEMLAATRRNGLISYQLAPTYEALMRELAAGTPVIVLQNLGVFDGWHYAVAVGYDFSREELILRSGETERRVMDLGTHEFFWRRGNYWAMVALPPDRIPVTANETGWLNAVIAFERLNDYRKNKAAFAAFLKRWPENLTAAIGLGNALHAAGELREAEGALREAAQRHPDSPVVLNNLAQTLSDLGKNDEALSVIERAAAQPGKFAGAIAETKATILKRLTSPAGAGPAPR